MPIETFLSIATLSAFIWALRFLVPKALKSGDGMAVTCSVLMAILALLLWLLIGIGARSTEGSRSSAMVPLRVSERAARVKAARVRPRRPLRALSPWRR